jgi:choline kinase
VVDFEYAGLNPAAFDIANHFHEWTADYHSATPHLLDPSRYPNNEQRRNFYRAYLEYSSPMRESTIEYNMEQLDKQVRVWSPASHGMWAVWGLVQAREALEGEAVECEFDYVGYALSRVEGFRREIKELGLYP